MRNALFSFLILATLNSYAQKSHPDSISDGKVFVYVDQMPAPKFDLGKYLSENLHYPDSARAHDIQGRVIVKFIVNENGKVSDCSLAHSVDVDLDNEALRVVRSMPRWKPGIQNGKPVKVFFNLPIVFKLED